MSLSERFIDKILICIECKEEFVFSASAQEYFAAGGFNDDPKRCTACFLKLQKGQRRPFRKRGDDARDDRSGDDPDDGVGVLVWRWPPDGYPPRHLNGHQYPPDRP
jgi:hypothetical protein